MCNKEYEDGERSVKKEEEIEKQTGSKTGDGRTAWPGLVEAKREQA